MKLTLGFSPCPNDTFIFDALVHQKIDTSGLEFEPVLADVETLNEWALEEKLDITKLSFPAFFRSLPAYTLLNSGSALGKGVGPLLVSTSPEGFTEEKINGATVILPGQYTTAHFLFSFAYPEVTRKEFMIFSAIENALLNKEASLGVIIHESRFTYQQKGLHKVKDLGEHWEEKMKLPVPLGGIAVNQSVKKQVAQKADELVRKSIEHAFSKYPHITGYVKEHSFEMSEEVMRQHIELYVNNFSLNLGEEGKTAIRKLYDVFLAVNLGTPDDRDILFL